MSVKRIVEAHAAGKCRGCLLCKGVSLPSLEERLRSEEQITVPLPRGAFFDLLAAEARDREDEQLERIERQWGQVEVDRFECLHDYPFGRGEN